MKDLFIFILVSIVCILTLKCCDNCLEFDHMALSKEEKVLPLSKLTVFQVVTTNEALVKEDSDSAKSDNQIYFLISDGEELYYDKQKIRVPNGKVVKMIGVYQYESRGKICTVPAIRIDPLPQKNKSK